MFVIKLHGAGVLPAVQHADEEVLGAQCDHAAELAVRLLSFNHHHLQILQCNNPNSKNRYNIKYKYPSSLFIN